MRINEALKLARSKRNYNKSEFGRLLGMKHSSANSTVNRYESGERSPGSDMLEKWFHACGCRLSLDSKGWHVEFDENFSKKIA